MFDLRNRDIIAKTPEISGNPFLFDAIMSENSHYSLILIDDKNTIKPEQFQRIGIAVYPYYHCFESESYEYDFLFYSGSPPSLLLEFNKCVWPTYASGTSRTNTSLELRSTDGRLSLYIPANTEIININNKSELVTRVCVQKVGLPEPGKTEKYNFTPSWINFSQPAKLSYHYYDNQGMPELGFNPTFQGTASCSSKTCTWFVSRIKN